MCLAVGMAFIRNICFGAYLAPKNMGYYSIALTIASYGMFIQMGLMSGLARELPVALGGCKGKYAADLVGETTKSIMFLQLLGVTIYFIIIAVIRFDNAYVQIAFFLGGLLALSIPFSELVMLRLRAEQKILNFSLIQFLNAAGILLIGLLGIKYCGFQGAIGTVIIINFATFFIVSRLCLEKANYHFFNIKDIYYLIQIGFPMMMAGVLLNLQMSMDRLFLIKDVSSEEIGIYQIGLLPLTLGIALNGIISQYVTPKLLFKFGQGKSLKYLYKKSLLVSLAIIVIMILSFPLVPWLAGYVIKWWLQAYKNSLPLITVFYIGAIFTASNIVGIVINAANRQRLCLFQAIFMVLICFLGYQQVSHHKMGLMWYAYINIGAQIINFLTMTGLAFYVVKLADKNDILE